MNTHPPARESADAQALRALRDVTPPPSLVANVMRQVSEPAPFSLRNWLFGRRRFQLSFTPLGLAVGAASLGLLVGALALVDARRTPPSTATASHITPVVTAPAPPATAEVVMVRFVLSAAGARKVSLAGDFNAWDPEATPLEATDADHFSVTVPLRRGETHSYMFVVDGAWITDPTSSERRPDGFGSSNSVIQL